MERTAEFAEGGLDDPVYMVLADAATWIGQNYAASEEYVETLVLKYLAIAGDATADGGFTPSPLSAKEQAVRLREYVTQNSPPFRDGYNLWFVLTAFGCEYIDNFWRDHPEEA